MDDLISRKAAIDAIVKQSVVDKTVAKRVLAQLPSAEPERKTGHWIEHYGDSKCSECGYELKIYNTNYCPNCGAEMRGGKDG